MKYQKYNTLSIALLILLILSACKSNKNEINDGINYSITKSGAINLEDIEDVNDLKKYEKRFDSKIFTKKNKNKSIEYNEKWTDRYTKSTLKKYDNYHDTVAKKDETKIKNLSNKKNNSKQKKIVYNNKEKAKEKSPTIKINPIDLEPAKIRKTTKKPILASQKKVIIVKKGDTLWRISNNNNVNLKKLISLNNIKNNKIYPGQKLLVPKK